MTLPEFTTAPAGAWIVALDAGKRSFQNRHYLPGLAPPPEQASHDFHGKIDVVEERFEPSAQIVQAGFAGGCQDKAVLRALAMTGEKYVTRQAGARKGIAFILAEFNLPG